MDVWKITAGTAIPTVSNTITASAIPAISAGTTFHSTTLTGWTAAVSANDIFGFNLKAVALCVPSRCLATRAPSVPMASLGSSSLSPAPFRLCGAAAGAPVDDVLEIARVGRHLLCDPLAPGDGYRALLAHNADGLVAWKAFLAA